MRYARDGTRNRTRFAMIFAWMMMSSALALGGGFAVQTASAADPTVEVGVSCTDQGPVLSFENDVEDASTVTIEDGSGATEQLTMQAGEKRDHSVPEGTYTITATSEGNPMRVNDQSSVTLDASCGDPAEEPGEGQTVGAETGCGEIGLENGLDEPVTVFIDAHDPGSSTQDSMTLPAFGGSDVPADVGSYTLTAQTEDGRSVPVNNQDSLDVNVPCEAPADPQTVLADGGCEEISFANEAGTEVDITVQGPSGTDTIRLAHMGDLGYPAEVGEYTITATKTDGSGQATVNNKQTETILVVECPVEAVNVDASSYDCNTLELENENKEVAVDVTISYNGSVVQTATLGPDERTRLNGFTEGETYTLRAAVDGRSATVNGGTSADITMEAC